MISRSREAWCWRVSLLALCVCWAPPALADLSVVDGLALRFDAASDGAVQRDGEGRVTRWRDTSGRGWDAVAEAPGRRPSFLTASAGSKAAVRFDGKAHFLAFRPLTLGDFTGFAVFTPANTSSVLLGDADNRDWIRVQKNGIKAKWNNVPGVAKGGQAPVGATQIFSVIHKGAMARFHLGGPRAGQLQNLGPFTPTHIGHKSTGGQTENFFRGDMHEILVYDRALTEEERVRVEQFLAGKWDADVKSDPDASAPSRPPSGISHGPMLGAVSETTAAIWLRTHEPREVRIALKSAAENVRTMALHTNVDSDNTAVVRVGSLLADAEYTYEITAGGAPFSSSFRTLGPSMKERVVRLVYGYGYAPRDRMEGDSIFTHMARRKGDLILFIGDFPYTAEGRRFQVHAQNRVIRENEGFTPLTCGTPTYAVWDDHDFGPNDCDGTQPNAAEALRAFKEYWANPDYGEAENPGIYSSFVVGDVEVFLLDGRYHSRQSEDAPTMLGARQFQWLCDGLSRSTARYKLLASGTPFSRVKRDCWGGRFYTAERERLFRFISEKRVTGVVAISGDIHRCDVHRLPMGGGLFLYDFTAGALARVHRFPPKKKWPDEMLYSYGNTERNMFGEIDFHPVSDTETALTFRSFSGVNGVTYRLRLRPQELGLSAP